MHACYMHTYALMRLRANFNRSWNCILFRLHAFEAVCGHALCDFGLPREAAALYGSCAKLRDLLFQPCA